MPWGFWGVQAWVPFSWTAQALQRTRSNIYYKGGSKWLDVMRSMNIEYIPPPCKTRWRKEKARLQMQQWNSCWLEQVIMKRWVILTEMLRTSLWVKSNERMWSQLKYPQGSAAKLSSVHHHDNNNAIGNDYRHTHQYVEQQFSPLNWPSKTISPIPGRSHKGTSSLFVVPELLLLQWWWKWWILGCSSWW